MDIEHFTSKSIAEKIDNMLVENNYKVSKNPLLHPSIYKTKTRMQGYYLKQRKTICGGVCFYVDEYNWVYVEDLFVASHLRGQGYGKKLMQNVIEWARQNKCDGIRLETWDFQARPFYEKLGFVCYGQLEGHPRGQIENFMAWRNNEHIPVGRTLFTKK